MGILNKLFSFKELSIFKTLIVDKTEIIYFGSSVNEYKDQNDKDKRPISKILDSLNLQKVGAVSHGAYNIDLYYYYLIYYIKNKSLNKKFIFEINMSSFGPPWDKAHFYQFEKEKIILKDNWMSPFYYLFDVFHYNFSTISKNDYYNTNIEYKDSVLNKVGYLIELGGPPKKFEDIKLRIAANYMTNLNNENQKIISLRNMLNLVSENNIDIYFYFTQSIIVNVKNIGVMILLRLLKKIYLF